MTRDSKSEYVAHSGLSNKQEGGQWMLVDTAEGLKIVKATASNFFSSKYAVQCFGTREEMEREKARFEGFDFQ